MSEETPDDPGRAPPEGFQRHARRSGLTNPWEPIYARHGPGMVALGLWAGQAHVNSRGFVHGGLISALADNAMGLSCGEALRAAGSETAGLVTVNLSLDFVGSSEVGQWLEIRPTVIRAGRSLCFASALVMADDGVCARASAVFKASFKTSKDA